MMCTGTKMTDGNQKNKRTNTEGSSVSAAAVQAEAAASTAARTSTNLTTAASRPKLPRQPSTGDIDNDAILQAMTASEKKAAATNVNIATNNTTNRKPPPPSKPSSVKNLSTKKNSTTDQPSSSSSSSKKKKAAAGLLSSSRENAKFAGAASMSSSSLPSLSEVAVGLPVTKGNNNSSASATAVAASPAARYVPKSLRESEENITRKNTVTIASPTATATASSRASAGGSLVMSPEPLPGAYSIQGQTVSRAATGILTKNDPLINTSTATTTTSTGRDERTKKKSSKKKGIVVAAELTEDVELMLERKIEEEVRKRLVAQAAKADVIAVGHGVNASQNREILAAEQEARRVADLKEIHKPRGVREKLFGDKRQTVDVAASPECIRKRDFLHWSVKRNPTTGQWVTSVMTNQKAMEDGNNLEAELTKASYSATTQEEAYETGMANAVPLMQSFDDNPICYVCKSKFALFRRPCHCRNCGVCICSNCTTTWPSQMFPPTYLRKNDKAVLNVCVACDWIQNSFREALLTGNRQGVEDLYATGNVNIRSPFCLDKKGEDPYPIHLAIIGGNLDLIRWMVETRYVPLQMLQKNGRKSIELPILTSHGRSPLGIALLHQRLDIVRYLVVDLNLSFFDEENLNTGVALASFTSLLKMIPVDFFDRGLAQNASIPQRSPGSTSNLSDSVA